MLKAKTKQGKEILYNESPIPQDILCPHCNSKVSYVKIHLRLGNFVIPHFRHKTECIYQTEPESKEHLFMKTQVYEKLKPYFEKLELEIKLTNRIADLFGKDKKGNKIVIECQHSRISQKEIIERTNDYTQMGYYTLWILHINNFMRTTPEEEYDGLYRIGSAERWLHKINYGRVYYFLENFGKNIINTHFIGTGRCINNSYTGQDYYKYYKIYKESSQGQMPNNLGLLCFDNDGFKIARFYDKKWW